MPQVSLKDLVEGVNSGDRLISFPTDTVPALASRPDRANLIFAAKQRSFDKPLILMAAAVEDLWEYVTGSAEERFAWEVMANRYLPGALTLVLPASDRVPPALNPNDPSTIGVRVPNHAIACAILTQTGPLATTSANRSGEPALQTMSEIEAQFPEVLTLAPTELAGLQSSLSAQSESTSGIPSTVIRWMGNGWKVLRQGAITLEDTV
ncbi:putative translation factor (SUA5) [Leptolyngbyaceae cyanobacterium JSC-12]|nr:putative translation factor (SUA5) [Leptolyngbyaceae cyanobacterium JSC-12]